MRQQAYQSLRRLRHRWSRLPRFARAVAVNMFIGLGIEAMLLLLHGSRLMITIEDASIDWMIRMYAATPLVESRPTIPFTFFDIDDETYRQWGEPVLTPRDKLLTLIRFATDRGAKLVVVDVDLSRRWDVAHDRALVDYVAHRDDGQPGSDPRSARVEGVLAPIIFVRTFDVPRGPEGTRRARTSILDGILRSAPRVYMSAPLFELDHDLSVRRWRLWEPTCGNPLGDVVPSIQLLVLTLSTSEASTAVDETVASLRHYACRYRIPGSAPPGHQQALQMGPVRLHLDETHLGRRIIYTLPWKMAGHPTVLVRGQRTPVLVHLSAHVVSDTPDAVSPEAVVGRAVVIGGSFTDGRDVYATPLGPMPGAWIIINAVQSMLQFGELRQPPSWVKLLVLTGMILVVSVLFAWLKSFFAMLACGVAIVGLMLPASLWLFRAGVWLEFVIPLLGVLGHHLYAQVEEAKHAGIVATHHPPKVQP